MPRKIPLTTETLNEIIKNLPSGNGGGGGKLYQLEFTAEARGEGGTYIVIADSDNELYSFNFKVLIYESEFERFVSEENGIILSDDEPLNMPTNINDFVSYLNNLFVLGGRTPEQFEVLNSLVNYSNKTLMCESSGGVIGEYDVVSPQFSFSIIHYSPSVNASKTLVYSHNYGPDGTIANIVFSTPCTLTEYGTSSSDSQGGDSSESTGMQRWVFTFNTDENINVYTKFTQSELSSLLADTNTNIDAINTMMGISLNHISSFNDIGTLITQSQTIDSTGVLTETLIGTFMGGLCANKKTIGILQDGLFGKRTVVNCYPTVDVQMQIVTNYNCVIVNNQNQFVTLQINGTNASAGYEEM